MFAVFRLLAVLLVAFLAASAAAQQRGDLTDDVDRYAAAIFDRIQPRSIADDREFCGYIGVNGTGKLAATGPKRGRRDSCEPDEPPEDFKILASYHTHGAYTQEADTEVPSLEDLAGDIEEGIDGYIATPGGRLWLNDARLRRAFLLCGPGCVKRDRRFRECRAYPPGHEYTLRSLQRRAENDTGEC